MKRLAALLLLAACALNASAQSTPGYLPQFEKGMVSVGLQFGPSRPTSTNGFKNTVGGGIGLGVQNLYYLSDWIAAGVQLDYVSFGSKKWEAQASDLNPSLASPVPVQFETQSKAMSGSLVARLNLLQERSWTPYILGGIGRHTLSTKVDVLNSLQTGVGLCDASGSCSSSKSGGYKGTLITGGVGLEAFVIRGLSLSGEVSFRQFRIEGGDLFGRKSVESLSYLIGLTTWFDYK